MNGKEIFTGLDIKNLYNSMYVWFDFSHKTVPSLYISTRTEDRDQIAYGFKSSKYGSHIVLPDTLPELLSDTDLTDRPHMDLLYSFVLGHELNHFRFRTLWGKLPLDMEIVKLLTGVFLPIMHFGFFVFRIYRYTDKVEEAACDNDSRKILESKDFWTQREILDGIQYYEENVKARLEKTKTP